MHAAEHMYSPISGESVSGALGSSDSEAEMEVTEVCFAHTHKLLYKLHTLSHSSY